MFNRKQINELRCLLEKASNEIKKLEKRIEFFENREQWKYRPYQKPLSNNFKNAPNTNVWWVERARLDLREYTGPFSDRTCAEAVESNSHLYTWIGQKPYHSMSESELSCNAYYALMSGSRWPVSNN